MNTFRRYYQKLLDMLWEVEKPRDRGSTREGCWVDPETEHLAREYEKTLERYQREHPNGIRLYDTPKEEGLEKKV